jgi:hypothetical protein
MALDKKIAAAVRAAVTAEGQPAAVADRLIAWLDSLSDGNESLANFETTNRFLNDLFESIEADDEVSLTE